MLTVVCAYQELVNYRQLFLQSLFFKTNFIGNITTHINLSTVHVCFHTTTLELSSCNRLLVTESLKYLLSGP